jgi:hypothetical protein
MRGAGLAVSAALLAMATPAAAVDPPALEKAYTEHLGQLVTAPGKGGVNELNSRDNGTVGMRGTDLGASFESEGRLYFLFGDTFAMGGGTHLDDSIAVTDARSADRFHMPSLSWAAGADGSFAPLRVPQASHSGMEVPVEGIRAAGRTYVFFVSGWHRDTRSYVHQVLGHFSADTMRTGRFVFDQVVETSRFLNVSAVKYEGYVYLFGAGNLYRRSPVWLARFRPRAIDRYKQWRFLGQPLRNGRVHWEQREDGASQLVNDSPPCVGELSVRRDPTSGYFLMAYNCDDDGGARPRGYYLRAAPRPWGPWSSPILLFDATANDGGYGVTQHFSTVGRTNPDDGLAEPDHLFGRDVFGGEYGPYLIPRFFRWEGGALSIVYGHSSWNPYKVHLMRTVLVPPGSMVGRPDRGAGLPRATIRNANFDDGISGWERQGTPFRVVALENRHYVSSYVPQGPGDQNGDDVKGALYQDFTLDDHATTLCFRTHGGGVFTPGDFQMRNVAAVRLYHGKEIVRESFGWNSDLYQDVRWNIQEFAGEPLRLEIADNATGPWGFIDATNFRLAGDNCAPIRPAVDNCEESPGAHHRSLSRRKNVPTQDAARSLGTYHAGSSPR